MGVGFIFILALALFLVVLFLRGRNQAHAARWAELEQRWEVTLLNALSGDASLQDVWNLVRPREDFYFIKYLWRFHKTFSGEERKLIEELAEPYLDRLALRLADRLPETRARAIVSLTALGRSRFARRIAEALDDKSDLVSMQAAWSLAQTRDPAFLPLILAHVGRYQSWSRGYLVSLFAAMGVSAAPTLRSILADRSKGAGERELAARVLRELNDFASAAPAESICENETDPGLLTAVIALLGQVGGVEHLGRLHVHCRSADAGVRAQALHALGQLGGVNEWMRLLDSMSDASPLVCMEAAQAIIKAGGAEILRDLSLSRDRRAPLASQALEGMA